MAEKTFDPKKYRKSYYEKHIKPLKDAKQKKQWEEENRKKTDILAAHRYPRILDDVPSEVL